MMRSKSLAVTPSAARPLGSFKRSLRAPSGLAVPTVAGGVVLEGAAVAGGDGCALGQVDAGAATHRDQAIAAFLIEHGYRGAHASVSDDQGAGHADSAALSGKQTEGAEIKVDVSEVTDGSHWAGDGWKTT